MPKKERKKIFTICANWHFPIVKNQRNNFNKDEWVLLKDFNIRKYIIENKLEGRIQNYMIDEEKILEAFSRFNHSGERMLP